MPMEGVGEVFEYTKQFLDNEWIIISVNYPFKLTLEIQ